MATVVADPPRGDMIGRFSPLPDGERPRSHVAPSRRTGSFSEDDPPSPSQQRDSDCRRRCLGMMKLDGLLQQRALGEVNPTESISLLRCLDRLGTEPVDGWSLLLPGGVHSLLRGFVRLTHLLSSLHAGGVPVVALLPRAVRVRSGGELDLDAEQLERVIPRDLDQAAPSLAPEVLLDPRGGHLGEPQAVYAIAALLPRCLAGTPPWGGRNAAEVADRILTGSPPSDSFSAGNLPPGLGPLLRDALHLDPAARPATLRGFASMLESVTMGGRPRAEVARRLTNQRQPHAPWGPILLVAAILIFALAAFRRSSVEDEIHRVADRLWSVMAVRPLPMLGEDPPTHALAGVVLRSEEHHIGALGDDPRLLLSLAWAQIRAGHYESAVRSARRVLLYGPRAAGAWVTIGIARLEMGDEGGLMELRRGLGMTAEGEEQRWLQVAGHFYLLEFDAAAAGFERWTRDHPRDFSGWLHLALSTYRAGRVESASKALTQAQRLRPHDPWVEWLRAEILLATGDAPGAILVVDRSKTAWVRQPALLLRGGDLLRRLGEEEGGEDWIQRAIEEYGDPEASHWLEEKASKPPFSAPSPPLEEVPEHPANRSVSDP